MAILFIWALKGSEISQLTFHTEEQKFLGEKKYQSLVI